MANSRFGEKEGGERDEAEDGPPPPGLVISSGPRPKKLGKCFLCLDPCSERCDDCGLIFYCCKEHFRLHKHPEEPGICLPYECSTRPGVGRVLLSTRVIRPLELILFDPGSLVGPNYTSTPVCLECLRPCSSSSSPCPGCRFPLCEDDACRSPSHQRHTTEECAILSRRLAEGAPPLPRSISREPSDGAETSLYSLVTPLRLLLLEDSGGDQWRRTDTLMDHRVERRGSAAGEWEWYQRNVCAGLREGLGMAADRGWTEERVHRAVGILNVNAVALKFANGGGGGGSRVTSSSTMQQQPVGKGLYPIFAIMSHQCVCNARYTLDPRGSPRRMEMRVRARRRIAKGEEITVQYLSALQGNLKRRKKIREEWYFDCLCQRCSDPTECGSNISAIKCFQCQDGDMLPDSSFSKNWKCIQCRYSTNSEAVGALEDAIEEQLDEIGKSGEFARYEDFIDKYSDTILHRNHFLIMTATRNLIQYLTYGASNLETTVPDLLKKKLGLCQHFLAVLGKVDPGFSEIRNFMLKEMNFCKLLLCQNDLEKGKIGREEYLRVTRQSLTALDEVEKNKKIMTQFK